MSAYELTRLDANTFEQLANMLALKVLGSGSTGFGPGPDGGRDGWFKGEAPYPSESERWSGTWYIQSKFHKPHLSTDPQKWLIQQVKAELDAFSEPGSSRTWPDNWIIATNIDPSGSPDTGAFDQIRALVAGVNASLAERTSVWGAQKLLAF